MKEDEVGGACIKRERDEKCIQNFSRKPEGMRPRGRHRRKWEDNIRMVPVW